jgi:hypothetical protein
MQAVSTIDSRKTCNMTFGHLDVSQIKRLVIVRKNGGVRTMKVPADIAKFVREHHADLIGEYPGGMFRSIKPGSDYTSVVISVKTPA